MPDCLFCKIINNEIPSTKVFEDELVYAFKDISPQAPIHMLIVPKKHIATINDVEVEDQPLLGHMISVAKDLAAQLNLSVPGYRLVFNCNEDAGQTVFHIHLHLLGGEKMGVLG